MLFYRLLICTLIPVHEVLSLFQSPNDEPLIRINNIK